MNLKHALNDQQMKAVTSLDGPILVISGAGSGKTRIITYRLAYMIDNGINPNEILTVTFTNKAADEMKERADSLTNANLKGIWMGTFHSIGARILQENLDKFDYSNNFSIYDNNQTKNIIKNIMERNNLTKSRIKPEKLQKKISSLKREMISPKDYLKSATKENKGIDDARYIKKIHQCYKDYQNTLRENHIFDFEDLIVEAVSLLMCFDDLREHYQSKFKYIQVDEYQDINHSQYKMVKILSEPQNNILVVGDSDQCQPPGTKVLTTNGYKNIEDLNPNEDKLPSYNRKSSHVIGLTDKYGYNFEKAVRDYTGKIKVIKTEDGKVSRCTPNHKWIIKWANKSTDYNVVYLMRKDNMYRVGHCQLFNSEGSFYLGVKSRLEGADDTWILKVFDNKADSYQWENIISVKYGIPQVTFKAPNNEKDYLTKKVIHNVYNTINTEFLKDNVLNCLKDFGLKHEYPIWTQRNKYQRRDGKSICKMQACNLIPDLMKIPVHIKGKKTRWVKIKEIFNEIYSGPVYSLNVDKYHKYISNGMVTCNSIYKFRGAELENILTFQDDFADGEVIKMEENYRSTKNIIQASNKLIKNNTNRLPKESYTNNKTGEPIRVIENKSPQAEGEFVARISNRLLSLGYSYSDIAVLYRSHFQSEPIETKLMENAVPYQVVSSFRFFDREEVRNFIGLLEYLNNPDNNIALIELMKIFNNNIGDKLINRISTHAKENNIRMIDLLPSAGNVKGIGPKRSESLKEFYNELIMPSIDTINSDQELSNKIDKIYNDIFDYNTLLEKYDNPTNRKENIDQLINYILLENSKGKDLTEILKSISLAKDKEDPSSSEKEDKVNLMTMHASKGTEFPVVILVGLEEDIIPHSKSRDKQEDIEEERRLLYVAMTRAMDKLFLSRCYSRLRFGQRVTPSASRFLSEIPQDDIQKVSNF